MEQIKHYDSIIIGFGKGGKTLANTMGMAGKKTALIEKNAEMYGGTCINVGCIPTKHLVYKSNEARKATNFSEKKTIYNNAIESELELTSKLRAKNLKKLEDTPNVTIITGFARLISSTMVEVNIDDRTELLEAEQIFINTGSVPVIPPIEFINTNSHVVVTSEGLLRQTTLPEHLAIIGGGYIGVEFASMYADFGSKVTIIQKDTVFLPKEDREIADAVFENLKSRGVEIIKNADIKTISGKKGQALITFMKGDTVSDISADTVLLATGRKPNTENLGLENAGIELNDRGGIKVNEHLQTTVPNIYAMGDVIGGLQFTYISLDDYRVVSSAVLGNGSYTTNKRGAVPYSVFLNPPFARVGMNEQEALDKGYSVKLSRLPAMSVPKAQVLENTSGILKAVIDERTDLILGAHLFCEEAHEIINIIKLAMDAGLPYTTLKNMIFTHPTMSEALNDLFNI